MEFTKHTSIMRTQKIFRKRKEQRWRQRHRRRRRMKWKEHETFSTHTNTKKKVLINCYYSNLFRPFIFMNFVFFFVVVVIFNSSLFKSFPIIWISFYIVSEWSLFCQKAKVFSLSLPLFRSVVLCCYRSQTLFVWCGFGKNFNLFFNKVKVLLLSTTELHCLSKKIKKNVLVSVRFIYLFFFYRLEFAFKFMFVFLFSRTDSFDSIHKRDFHSSIRFHSL